MAEQALYGTLFTWMVTALGSAVVFIEPLLPGSAGTHQLFLDTMLGFAGGVMIAASYWSLLAPGASEPSMHCAVDWRAHA
jgi:ZIP family zinc transporter